MEVTEVRDVHASCIVGEMGNCRADKKLEDRSIATGARCCHRREPPLGFYGAVLDLKEEMQLRPAPSLNLLAMPPRPVAESVLAIVIALAKSRREASLFP